MHIKLFWGKLTLSVLITVEKLNNGKDSFAENSTQTWERISGPSVRFTEEMMSVFKKFTDVYNQWREQSEIVISPCRKNY